MSAVVLLWYRYCKMLTHWKGRRGEKIVFEKKYGHYQYTCTINLILRLAWQYRVRSISVKIFRTFDSFPLLKLRVYLITYSNISVIIKNPNFNDEKSCSLECTFLVLLISTYLCLLKLGHWFKLGGEENKVPNGTTSLINARCVQSFLILDMIWFDHKPSCDFFISTRSLKGRDLTCAYF